MIYWKEHLEELNLDLSTEYNLRQLTVGLISKKRIICHRLDRKRYQMVDEATDASMAPPDPGTHTV